MLTAAVIIAAPGSPTTLGDVAATPVIQVLASVHLLNGLVATSAAILQREFMQKQRTIADQVKHGSAPDCRWCSRSSAGAQ